MKFDWRFVYLLFLVLLTACNPFFNDQLLNKVFFETIKQGDDSKHFTDQIYLVEDSSKWKDMQAFFSSPITTKIDFTQQMLVVIFDGLKKSGGFAVQVIQVVEKQDIIEVSIQKIQTHGLVTLMLTYPFYIMKMKRFNKPLIFKIKNVIRSK